MIRRKGSSDYTKEKKQNNRYEECQRVNSIEYFTHVSNGRDDAFDYIKEDMSSESRDEDDGFLEYESLSSMFNVPRPESPLDVVITVQAVTITSKRVEGDNILIDNFSLEMMSGHAIVGIVREVGNLVKEIKVGDRVATVIETLSNNPRYAKCSANVTVKVPHGVDSAEAASCAYTYLGAFQSINHGVKSHKRYLRNSLKDQKILVVDGISVIGQAAIQLVKASGAKEIYTIGENYHHPFLQSCGTIPLDSNDWLKSVEGNMDLVIVQAVHHMKYVTRKALKKDGKLVCIGTPLSGESLKPRQLSFKPLLGNMLAQFDLAFIQKQKATFYDFFSNIVHYPEIMKVCKYDTRY